MEEEQKQKHQFPNDVRFRTFYLCSPLFTFPFSNNCSYYYTIFPDPCIYRRIYRHINTKFDLFWLIFSHAIYQESNGLVLFCFFFDDKTNVLYMKFYKQNYANETISIVFVYKRENKMKKKLNVKWMELVEKCVRVCLFSLKRMSKSLIFPQIECLHSNKSKFQSKIRSYFKCFICMLKCNFCLTLFAKSSA